MKRQMDTHSSDRGPMESIEEESTQLLLSGTQTHSANKPRLLPPKKHAFFLDGGVFSHLEISI